MYAKIITIMVVVSLAVQSADKITYEDHIKDIFSNSCANCHKPSKRKGGLNLMTYADVLKGGSSGKIVEPGNIESLLVKSITHEEEPIMPPKGPKLETKEIELVRSWIKGGLLETASSQRVKVAKNTSLAMSSKAVAKGTVTLPEYLTLAKVMDKITVIRSMTHGEAAHERGTHNMFTGYRPSPAIKYPSMGSIVSHQLGTRDDMPPYICIPNQPNEFAGTGFLSSSYSAFSLGSDPASGGFKVRDLKVNGIDNDRQERRKQILEMVDGDFKNKNKADIVKVLI